MKNEVAGACSEARISMVYHGTPLSDASELLSKGLTKVKDGVTIVHLKGDAPEPSGRFDISRMLKLLDNYETEEEFDASLKELKSMYANKASISTSIPYRMYLPEDGLIGEHFKTPKQVSEIYKTRSKDADEIFSEVVAARKRINKYKFKSLAAFEKDISGLVKFKIPLTNKEFSIAVKNGDEITFDVKTLLKYGGLWAAMMTFLKSRITDWVLLKAAVGVSFIYFYWLFGKEFFHLDIKDIQTMEQKELDAFKERLNSKILKSK